MDEKKTHEFYAYKCPHCDSSFLIQTNVLMVYRNLVATSYACPCCKRVFIEQESPMHRWFEVEEGGSVQEPKTWIQEEPIIETETLNLTAFWEF